MRKEFRNRGVRAFILILIYVVAFVGSNLCFKKAGVAPDQSMEWWLWFGMGNGIGFLAPITITLALKEGSASWTFAAAMGGGFLALQISLWIFQGEPFHRVHGLGVLLITLGLILMQWGKGS